MAGGHAYRPQTLREEEKVGQGQNRRCEWGREAKEDVAVDVFRILFLQPLQHLQLSDGQELSGNSLESKFTSDHAKGKEILPSKVSSSGGTWVEFPCGGFGLMRPCPVRGWNEEPMMTSGPWPQVQATSGEAVSTLGRAQKALEDLDLPILYLFRTEETSGVYESIL